MKSLRKFEDYLNLGIVKKQSPDRLRADSLIQEAKRKEGSLKATLQKIGLDDNNANDIIEVCYDIMIGIIRAKMLLAGFNSSGIGAHEGEISYLRELKFEEADIHFADQLRYFRNGILYYGKRFDKEYAEKVYEFLNRIKQKLG